MKMNKMAALALAAVTAFSATGCGSEAAPETQRETTTTVLHPEAGGETVYEGVNTEIDATNSDDGYVMIKYDGEADTAKVQITVPDKNVYTYNVSDDFAVLPLSGGDGGYHIDILEPAFDDMYALIYSMDMDVAVSDEFAPFLYPNQYVWFTEDSKAVALARELSEKSADDLDFVTNVYRYVIKNVKYDDEKARTVVGGYVPDADRTLETGKGICLDYAALMATMLRSQGVPTKLIVGYSGAVYHAWISVYVAEMGWVDKIIQFDGTQWSIIDPTLAANNDAQSVKEYVSNGANYKEKYSY